MEGSHSATAGHAQQDDSWTCQRCGWVYPNAHPSAKHRRNHKKHCGKVKGFELQPELHKRGSSDEASSDDESHVNQESLPLRSAQIQHDSIGPVEAASVVLMAESPSLLQFRELPLPEKNNSTSKNPESPVLYGISTYVYLQPEVPAYESTRDVDLTDVLKPESYAVPDLGPFDKKSKTLGDKMDLITKDLAGEPTITSDNLEGNVNVGVLSRAEGVDAAVDDSLELSSNQIGGALVKDSIAAPEHAGRMACLNEPSRTIEEKGRVNILAQVDEVKKAAKESQVLDSDQSREAQKKEISTGPTEHPIKRQGSSQEGDSWTCRRCGWVYPNPHPSAKHRRNHKKHCGKLKGFEVQTEPHKGGSSDEVSSDEEKKEHIQHDLQQDTSQITPPQDQASGAITGTTISAEDQARDLSRSKGDSSAGGLPDTPGLKTVTASVESSNVDPAVSLAQRNLQRDGGNCAVALDQSILVPCVSDGQGIPQSKEEIPATQGDSTLNVENSNSSKLTVPATDSSQPADVGSSKDEMATVVMPISLPKAEGDKEVAVVMSISHPEVSGSTKESLDAFGGTGFQQAVLIEEKTGEAAEPVLVKPISSAGELPDSDFSCSKPPVLAAGSALDGEAKNLAADGISLKNVLPAMALRPADVTGSANDLEIKKKFVSLQTTNAGESSSVKHVLPIVALLPADETGSTNDLESEKKSVSLQTTPSAGEVSLCKEGVLPVLASPIADVTDLTNDFKGEKNFVSVQAPPKPDELQPKDEISSEIVGGLKDSSSCMDKVVKTPQVTQVPVQFLDDRATSVENSFLEKRIPADSEKGNTPVDTSGKAISVTDTPSSLSLPVEPNVIPVGVPLTSAEDTLATSTNDEVLGQIAGSSGEASSASTDRVVEAPKGKEMRAECSDSPETYEGVAVSGEKAIADSTGELLLTDDKPTSTITLANTEAIPESGQSALVGGTVATSTIMNMVNDSGPSSSPQESDQLSLVKDDHKYKTAELSGPMEIIEKPDIKDNTPYETDFGSSGRSLDGTNSFRKAESDFSQRSDFASSSNLLSDSLEIYEDAPDTLEACSVGGSVEGSESLDEPRQVAIGGQEDSKPLGVSSLDERVAGGSNELEQNPNVMNGGNNELEHPSIVMNRESSGEGIGEEKETTVPAGASYVRSNMEKLKAPSPEAWQEPGPSTMRKEGKKMTTSEVMEDGKSSESHTALRSLMAKEGKDKMDESVASPSVTVDAKSSGDKEASAIGKKSKSRLRSFWSQCVCCPAVH